MSLADAQLMSQPGFNLSTSSSGSTNMKRMMAGGYDGGDKRRNTGSSGGGGGMNHAPIGPMDHNKECRILIPSKHAGAVIGKGGDVIKRLRSEFNAHVNVPDSNAPERVLSVGGEFDNIKQVLSEVISKISDERSSKTGDVEFEIRILIHQSHAGAVIGKAGSKIKELRENSGAQLKVFATCAPMSTDRVVLIAGSTEQIVNALDGVHRLLEEIPVKGAIKPYDSLNYDPSYANDYGGLISQNQGGPAGGGPGSGRGPPRGNMGGGMGMMPRGGGGQGFYDEMKPPHHSQGGQPPRNQQQYMQPNPNDYGYGGGAMYDQQQMYGGGGGGGGPPMPPQPQGGQGTQSQIQLAQYLLQQCVRTSAAGRRYIDQQQSSGGYHR